MSAPAQRQATSLQRRLLTYLLVAAPLLWGITLGIAAWSARHEVNELFDTQIIRLAQEMRSVIDSTVAAGQTFAPTTPVLKPRSGTGAAEFEDLAIAVWDAQGRLLLVDREGISLPHRRDTTGFMEVTLGGEPWRVFYLQDDRTGWLVAAGQRLGERDELIEDLLASQLLPWALMLPALLLALAWAVRRAMTPLHRLTQELGARDADSLRPVVQPDSPRELLPLMDAMNGLFRRIDDARTRERRFTADAAHELRTPLALLRAQWDLLRSAPDEAARAQAGQRLERGIERMDRLVSQMLALSRLDAADALPQRAPVDWARVVEQVMSDTLALAGRRHIELACDWPDAGVAALPLQGDEALLAAMLRNLLDNAARYAPEGSTVTLGFSADALWVDNPGPPLSAAVRQSLGQRFHRPEGQQETGSGLGVSIVQRIAALHGLVLHEGTRADGTGVVMRLQRAAPQPGLSA